MFAICPAELGALLAKKVKVRVCAITLTNAAQGGQIKMFRYLKSEGAEFGKEMQKGDCDS